MARSLFATAKRVVGAPPGPRCGFPNKPGVNFVSGSENNQLTQDGSNWRFERLRLERPRGHWLSVLEAGHPGDGRPCLLFIHGAAGSWHNFRLQLEWLQTRFRVIALDLRGHGLSPWPSGSNVEHFVDDLVQVVEARIAEPFAIVAHSFGGCLAAHLTQRLRSGQVRGLALLNTAGNIPQGWMFQFLKVFARFSHWVAQIQPYWVSCHGSVAHHLLWSTLPQWDTWELSTQLRVPTLVVAGRGDQLIPWRSSQRLAESMPAARFHLIKTGRHVCMWENPQELHDQLEGWLSQLDWSGAADAPQ
jgi:pimeloyl-ACP methyl ester carboxylesterase